MHLLYPEGTGYQTWLPQTYLSLVLKIHLQIRQIHTTCVCFTYVYENESISNSHLSYAYSSNVINLILKLFQANSPCYKQDFCMKLQCWALRIRNNKTLNLFCHDIQTTKTLEITLIGPPNPFFNSTAAYTELCVWSVR